MGTITCMFNSDNWEESQDTVPSADEEGKKSKSWLEICIKSRRKGSEGVQGIMNDSLVPILHYLPRKISIAQSSNSKQKEQCNQTCINLYIHICWWLRCVDVSDITILQVYAIGSRPKRWFDQDTNIAFPHHWMIQHAQ